MNPIYKFTLSINGDTEQRVFPVYKSDITKDFELQTNEEFYRAKLSGKLTFERDDYNLILAQNFDTEFGLKIYISYNGGQTWTEYWTGRFWKTDCEFDIDNENIIVTPTVVDQYTDVLAGLEKEFDLIQLAPEIIPIQLDKRPMVQVYVPGQSVISCFLSGMWWEQECEPEDDTAKLENQFHFALNKTQRIIDVLEEGSIDIPDVFMGPATAQTNAYEFTNGAYKFKYVIGAGGASWQIVRVSDETILWFTNQTAVPTIPYELTLGPNTDAGVTGNVKIFIHDVRVYARYVTDVEQALGLTTYPIPSDDIVENNRNYHYVIGYYFPSTIYFYDGLSETPTQWGLYQPGLYYQMFTAPIYGINESFPVARSAWGRISIWFAFDLFDWLAEQNWRKGYTLKDAFPIWAVISALLAKIAPNITHAGTAEYSQFLYGTNPISNVDPRLFITPKSNLISAGYDQPARKAPITLKHITDMLRDCFRCFWYIDAQNRFCVEHISWFMRGGTYTGQPNIGIDLTQQVVTRNGKPWAYARNQYQFDKPEMAARYQFGWMDDVTELFDGYPIDVISKYVNPDNIEQIDVPQFTSDVDYILLNPGAISKDGFVLLAAVIRDTEYYLPYVNFTVNFSNHILQNGLVAFAYLQQYYMYDMPASNVQINGVPQFVFGTKKLKTQTIKFPVLVEPDMFNLIKTGLGDGTIQKLSINLSSRNANATLKYGTE